MSQQALDRKSLLSSKADDSDDIESLDMPTSGVDVFLDFSKAPKNKNEEKKSKRTEKEKEKKEKEKENKKEIDIKTKDGRERLTEERRQETGDKRGRV